MIRQKYVRIAERLKKKKLLTLFIVKIAAQNCPKMQKSALQAKFIIIVAVAVVALVAAIIIGMNISEKNALAEYEDNLSIVVGLMYDSAVDAEEAGNLFHDVWYNCIYEKSDPETDPFTRTDGGVGAFYDDFNEALWALEEDPEYAETISSIESTMGVVQTYIKDLQNPPEEFRTAYESVKELYDAYYVFTNLVVDPEGSLSSFTEEFNAADSDVASCLNDAMLYIE